MATEHKKREKNKYRKAQETDRKQNGSIIVDLTPTQIEEVIMERYQDNSS